MSDSELVDIVDENDHVIDSVTRAVMRQRRLRHRCVYILLFDGHGRLFVHRRTTTKDVYPGYWDVAIGGVVGAGETYERGAYREVAEEVGLVDVNLAPVFPIDYEDEHTRVRGMVYECSSDRPLRLQCEEIVEGRWLRLEEVRRLAADQPFCPDGLAVFDRYIAARR